MFSGRRQPSRGGTSRMMREYQVRICERLGVQFPGPTRRVSRAPQELAAAQLPPDDDLLGRINADVPQGWCRTAGFDPEQT